MDRRRAPRTTELITNSPEETLAYAAKIRKNAKAGAVFSLMGELGSGKTTFVKGLVSCHEREVSSPTFTYLHIYPGEIPIYHFDLYRLKDVTEFLAMGFDEYLHGDGICCVEWAERIESILPKHTLFFHFSHSGEERRKIVRHEWD
ncbi:MAG: tRNA (adenosine(37)-N6)-threonylcarbamoyltransferase complex ATPase subunit type 1 TsaE [Chlamydiales bacterium]